MTDTKYIPTIGLEVHAELSTKTKMFCNSKNDPDETRPNINICPVCMAHPGTLPVINKEAVKHVLRVGQALGGELADFTEFDRKNYFYPDIPKAYQISQYKYPLVSGGSLKGVDITRVHLEEDTARSQHDNDKAVSLVDFNRAGLPLMELVTEPVMHSAREVADFARELQLLLSPAYLGVSEANMEKGELRIEANISVSPQEGELGTKVEVKNLNSFRAVERAVDFEIKRHIEVLESGGEIVQETRGWDENKGVTFSQRKKEQSHDYRYFPDPDLPKLYINEIAEFRDLDKTIPELPEEKRERYQKEFEIKSEDIETYIRNISLGEFFEQVAKELQDKKLIKTASNFITSDGLGILSKEEVNITKDSFGNMESGEISKLVKMYEEGEISSRGAKDILAILIKEGGKARNIAEKKGLFQKSDEGELLEIVKEIITENPDVVADYKAGNDKLIQFMIGQGMKKTGGSANPGILAKIFKKELSN